MTAPREDIAAALALLEKRHLVLAIHDPSFPSSAEEDFARGSPYTRGGRDFVRFAHLLGFDGIQLGPQGQTTWVNQSPYDGTLFSKCVLSIDFAGLVADDRWDGVFRREDFEGLVADGAGDRVAHKRVFSRVESLLSETWQRFAAAREEGRPGALAIDAEASAFAAKNQSWLERDALYEAVAREHGEGRWRKWPDVDRSLWSRELGNDAARHARLRSLREEHRDVVGRWALFQTVVHADHARFRSEVRSLGVKLFGDVQVGLSPRDAWGRQAILLPGYRLGAPPSRTNPEGQPWSHSVLDPAQYRDETGADGPVIAFVKARLGKMLGEFDGLRIDHPHGIVCPWVYRAEEADPFSAVQSGARLFESPDLPDHPELARHAIARPSQIDRSQPRHADGWVRELDDAQVDQLAILFDALVTEAERHGREKADILCEVLSTQPYPLRRVMERHGLGRFRVTQKADVNDPDNVYRSENARPLDWIMVGNHDTAPIWRLAAQWHGTDAGAEQAGYLARRLRPDGRGAEGLAAELRGDARKLVHAKMADLFVSHARNVMVFFPDLLGMDEVYNKPGTVSDDNWSLRVPSDYRSRHATAVAEGRALDLACVLALALRARGHREGPLVARLEASAWWVPA